MNQTPGVEHQATVDKGLKMKIKRKNVGTSGNSSSKSDNGRHEIIKTDTKAPPSVPSGGPTSSSGTVAMDTSDGPAPPRLMGSPPMSALDKLKQALAEKESGKGHRGGSGGSTRAGQSKRGGSKEKVVVAPTAWPGKPETPTASLTSTANSGQPSQSGQGLVTVNSSNTNNSSFLNNSVTVELDRLGSTGPGVASSSSMNKKEQGAGSDPYEFNAKLEDGIGLPVKKVKVEKVRSIRNLLQKEIV